MAGPAARVRPTLALAVVDERTDPLCDGRLVIITREGDANSRMGADTGTTSASAAGRGVHGPAVDDAYGSDITRLDTGTATLASLCHLDC